MNFFLDENFPKSAVKLLSERDHPVFDIRSTVREVATDDAIFRLAQDGQSIFLTTDKDFYHTVPFHYPHHHGIIVILLHQPNRRNIIEKLEYFLDHFDLEHMRSKVILFKENHYSVIER